MRKLEQLKLFTGDNANKLEKQYNAWYKTCVEERAKVPALAGNPFVILSRTLTIRNYQSDETFGLAIFYEYMELEDYEQGPDRGGGLDGGVSAVRKRKR